MAEQQNLNWKVVSTWVLAVLLGGLFIVAGVLKLVGLDFLKESFIAWEYTLGFMFFIGILELLGGIAILIPRLSSWGAILIAIVMLGAAYTHMKFGEQLTMLPVLVMACSIFLAYLRRGSAILLSPSKESKAEE